MASRKTSMIIDPEVTAAFSKATKDLAARLKDDQVNLSKAKDRLHESHKDEQYKSMEPLIDNKGKRIKQLVGELEQYAKFLDELVRRTNNYISTEKMRD